MLMRIRSAYLRNERKYDRWGGLGKLLAAVEVMRSAGVEDGAFRLDAVVNAAFPRTFSHARTPEAGEGLPNRTALQGEIDALALLFMQWGVATARAEYLATEEVGERHRLATSFLREYLK